MSLTDEVVIEIDHDVDGDGSTENGKFVLLNEVQHETEIRTSFLLNNSLDRVQGAYQQFANKKDANKRAGQTTDVGGGRISHTITAEVVDGSNNQFGDGSASSETDATGESARRKVRVLEQYLRTSTNGSEDPIRLKSGEYNSSGGVYANFHPTALATFSSTVNAQGEQSVTIRIELFEVAETPGVVDTFTSAIPF